MGALSSDVRRQPETAGVAAALVTGTNIGLAIGSVGGPAGWILGAAAGATLGLGIWAISSFFGG